MRLASRTGLLPTDEATADIRAVFVDGALALFEEFATVLDDQQVLPREREVQAGGAKVK